MPSFLEFVDYARLIEAALKTDARTHVIALLGGRCGPTALRRGEKLGPQWTDVDFVRRPLVVSHAVWEGKDGDADDGLPATSYQLRTWFAIAQRRAGLPHATGGLHVLRHTFCSHLAMRGAPAKAIQELAGRSDLSTTLRSTHLSPAARQGAIALLNDRRRIFWRYFGDGLGGHRKRGNRAMLSPLRN